MINSWADSEAVKELRASFGRLIATDVPTSSNVGVEKALSIKHSGAVHMLLHFSRLRSDSITSQLIDSDRGSFFRFCEFLNKAEAALTLNSGTGSVSKTDS